VNPRIAAGISGRIFRNNYRHPRDEPRAPPSNAPRYIKRPCRKNIIQTLVIQVGARCAAGDRPTSPIFSLLALSPNIFDQRELSASSREPPRVVQACSLSFSVRPGSPLHFSRRHGRPTLPVVEMQLEWLPRTWAIMNSIRIPRSSRRQPPLDIGRGFNRFTRTPPPSYA